LLCLLLITTHHILIKKYYVIQDHESTEHDGDVEDYSEGENGTTGSEKSHHRLIYYPPSEDIISNQFTVNAIDVEELRRFVLNLLIYSF